MVGFIHLILLSLSMLGVAVFGLLKMIILFIVFTLIIATVTLIERKVLALVQRRVGPNYIGYKGRLQFLADALKLLFKHITIISRTNRALFIAIPALILIVSYLF
jgi:NADH-quinone oxidoreductase subunit H